MKSIAASKRAISLLPRLRLHLNRPLSEFVDIFKNGPRPVSVALPLLNDEEVVLLARTGKIAAAYALEEVSGNTEYERAVRIRRALIRKSDSLCFFVPD